MICRSMIPHNEGVRRENLGWHVQPNDFGFLSTAQWTLEAEMRTPILMICKSARTE